MKTGPSKSTKKYINNKLVVYEHIQKFEYEQILEFIKKDILDNTNIADDYLEDKIIEIKPEIVDNKINLIVKISGLEGECKNR